MWRLEDFSRLCSIEWGTWTDARQLWEKNLKDDPGNASLWINMGLSYERDGKVCRSA